MTRPAPPRAGAGALAPAHAVDAAGAGAGGRTGYGRGLGGWRWRIALRRCGARDRPGRPGPGAACLLRAIDPRRQPGQAAREVTLSQRRGRVADCPVRAAPSARPGAGDLVAGDRIGAGRHAGAGRAGGAVEVGRRRVVAAGCCRRRRTGGSTSIQAAPDGWLPRIERLSIGRPPVPAWLAEWALPWWLSQHVGADELALARDGCRARCSMPKLTVRYAWHAGTAGRLMSAWCRSPSRRRCGPTSSGRAGRLKSVAGGRIPLVQVLPPVFELARQRSARGQRRAGEPGGDPGAGVHAVPARAAVGDPGFAHLALPPRWPLTLYGRDDFPLHFLISAALAVEAERAAGRCHRRVQGDARHRRRQRLQLQRHRRRPGWLPLRAARPGRCATLAGTRIGQGVTDADLLPDVSDLPRVHAGRPSSRLAMAGSMPRLSPAVGRHPAPPGCLPLYR